MHQGMFRASVQLLGEWNSHYTLSSYLDGGWMVADEWWT